MRRTAQQFSEPQHYKLISSLTSFTRVMLKLGVFDGERKEFLAVPHPDSAQASPQVGGIATPGGDRLSLSQVE
jgi:hypothetical protein